MTESAKKPTPSPARQRELDRLQKDIERHLVMKGHPPTGAIIPKRPKSEIERRIKESRERQSQFNALVASRKKAMQTNSSSTTS